MIAHRNGTAGAMQPLEIHWDSKQPLEARWVVPEGRRFRSASPAETSPPFDFTTAMGRLCTDVSFRCGTLRHIQMPRVLVSFTPSRNRSRFGLQARVTPLRFRDGKILRRHGAIDYQVQKFIVDGREMLYILTFCLPRFLDQSFDEKLITVFHELYHMSPAFDGDLRRHPGRYAVHSHSKARYDLIMAELAKEYVNAHPEPEVFSFLRLGYTELWDRHRGVTGVIVPRPKLLPVGWSIASNAARNQENKPH